jgi:hypothetical protein
MSESLVQVAFADVNYFPCRSKIFRLLSVEIKNSWIVIWSFDRLIDNLSAEEFENLNFCKDFS